MCKPQIRVKLREAKAQDKKVTFTDRRYIEAANIETHTIRNVCILKPVSANGHTYSEAAMRQVAEKANGAQIYANHADWYPVVRKVEHLLGKLENVAYVEASKEVRGDAVLVPGELTDKVLAVAQKMPEMLGFSIVAEGIQEEKDGQLVVTEITRLESVDVVTKPATVTSLFESIQQKPSKKKEADDSDDDKKDEKDLEKENEDLRKEVEALKKELKDLKAEKEEADKKAKESATAEAFRAAGLDPNQHKTIFEFLSHQPADLRDKAIAELKEMTARAQTGLPSRASESAMMNGQAATGAKGSTLEDDVNKLSEAIKNS